MKKVSFSELDLDKNKLSTSEKKQVIGGSDEDCLVPCWCNGETTFVPLLECGRPCYIQGRCGFFWE